jgi:hypothetical protein
LVILLVNAIFGSVEHRLLFFIAHSIDLFLYEVLFKTFQAASLEYIGDEEIDKNADTPKECRPEPPLIS